MTATAPSTRCSKASSPRIRAISSSVDGSPRSIVARDGPRPGKVGLVIGGGSGHEPTFLGFVGKGLADAAAIGNVFASPPPDPILECAKAVSGGAGVLFMYGNYAGDVMNFDMAAEMAAMDDIEVRTVLTTDDVASAPRDQRDKRRGVAGNFFIFKAAGAACDRMLSFDECERIARKANDHTFTMGVALSPCSLPQTRRPNFEIGADEMEIGMGIHGEPGIARGKLKTADEITDEMLDRILAEMAPSRGDKVAVLVNSLGSTPLMELYIMNRRVKQRLDDIGVAIHATWVGNYCTSLEMAGASVTLHASRRRAADDARPSLRLRHVPRRLRHDHDSIDTARLKHMFDAIAAAIEADKDRLCAARRRHRRCRPRHRHGARLRRGARRACGARPCRDRADSASQHGGKIVPQCGRRLLGSALCHGVHARRRSRQGQGGARGCATSSPCSRRWPRASRIAARPRPAKRR